MIPSIASWIPLVCRPKPPGRPLAERLAELTALTTAPAGMDRQQLVARASGVLNFAALIASDVGMPDLAAELCWRHYQVFAEARTYTQETAVMALMPVVNIARLMIREGDDAGAYRLLQDLYRAAQRREALHIGDYVVDVSALIRTDDDHRKICEELWTSVLIDGARALACNGRWTKAAKSMAAHRGIGNRLLDGRQIMIMSLMERDRIDQAVAAIDTTASTEPWEDVVAALLRIACWSTTSRVPNSDLERGLQRVLTLVGEFEPSMVAFRVRVGLAALELVADQGTQQAVSLRSVVIEAASMDAYAARTVLGHMGSHSSMNGEQKRKLQSSVAAAGFGVGSLSAPDMVILTHAVSDAERRLGELLMPSISPC